MKSPCILTQRTCTGSNSQKDKEVNFSQFMSDVDQGIVREVTVIGVEVRGKYKSDNSAFHTTVPPNFPDMYKTLRDKGVSINVKDISMKTPLVSEGRVMLSTSCTAVTFRFLSEEERARIAAERAKKERQ